MLFLSVPWPSCMFLMCLLVVRECFVSPRILYRNCHAAAILDEVLCRILPARQDDINKTNFKYYL